MNEGTTSSSDPDASSTTETDQPTETVPDSEHEDSDDTTDTSAMARALKHELEQKGMYVDIEDDGETLSAEKLDQSYRIRPDGTVEGNGVLKDGIENIVADLDPVDDTEAENPDIDAEPAAGGGSDDNTSSIAESEESEEDEKSDTPSEPAETESTAEAVEDDDTTASVEEEEEEQEQAEAESLPTGTVRQFEASIEAGRLQQALDAVNAVVDECRIHLDTDELVIRAVDPANVAMIDEHVSTDAFEAYETSCGVLGINLERLIEVVEIADNDDDLVQFDNDAETRKLHVQVNSVEYTLALIDPDSIRQEPEIPDLDLPASVAIEQAEVKRAFRAADMVSDHIRLRVDEQEECFIAEAEGDTDDVELELGRDDLTEVSFGPANSLFSLDYLKDIRRPIPKETTVRMELGEEFPVRLAFEMVDDTVTVEFLVAPRIDSR